VSHDFADRASHGAGQSLRRPLGHGPGRARRLDHDARRLRPATAARQVRARTRLRHVRQAREQLYGTTSELPEPASQPSSGHESGHEAALGESDAPTDERIGERETPGLAAGSRIGETRTRTGDTTISGTRRTARSIPKDRQTGCPRSRDSAAMPAVSLGFGRVRDFAGAVKSQSTNPPTIACVRRRGAVARPLGRPLRSGLGRVRRSAPRPVPRRMQSAPDRLIRCRSEG
jgi:hypothetical protein